MSNFLIHKKPDSDDAGKALIADMDGTVLTVNSWRIFSKAVLVELLRLGRFAKAARLVILILKKKLGRIEHREVKYNFGRASQEFGQQFFDRIIAGIKAFENREAMDFIRQKKADGMTIVLASAAAGEYAFRLGRELMFDYVIATPEAGAELSDYRECKGAEKVRHVNNLLEEFHLSPAIVMTDHWHDLPLMQAYPAAEKYLINPSSETLAACSHLPLTQFPPSQR